MGLLEENGPCFVSADSKSTYLNEWSWNNDVNSKQVLYSSVLGTFAQWPCNETEIKHPACYRFMY